MSELDETVTTPEQNVEQEQELDTIPEDLADVQDEQAVKMKENFEKALAQKKKWREKAIKAEEELKAAKKPVPSSPAPSTTRDLSVRDVLKLQNLHYSNEEIQLLDKYSTRLNMPIDELIEDPLVKSGIEAMRYQRKVEQATPAPSRRTQVIKGKSVEKMTAQERATDLNFNAWKSRKVSGE